MIAEVVVRHPVPARLVLPGRRRERNGHVRATTPASLRILPEDAATRLGTRLPRGHPDEEGHAWHHAWFLEGRIWATLGLSYGRDGQVIPILRGEEFLAWLEADEDAPRQGRGGLGILHGTPLMQRDPGEEGRRGIDESEVRILSRREDERAAAAVRRVLAEDVVIVGQTPLVRVAAPLLDFDRWPDGPAVSDKGPFRGGGVCARPDRGDAFAASLGLSPRSIPKPRCYQEPYGADELVIAPEALGDADLVRFANLMPGEVLDFCFRTVDRCRDRAGWLDGPFAALLAWDRIGAIGAVGRDEVERVALDVLAALDAMARAFPNKGAAPWLRDVEAYIRGFVLPTLAEGAPPPEDVDALAALGT